MTFPPAGSETLQELIDTERADSGAEQRAAEFWNHRIEAESMTLAGRLVAAAERHDFVRLSLINGTTRQGKITAVGSDVFTMRLSLSTRSIIAINQLATLRVDNQTLVTHDAVPAGARMRDLLGELADLGVEVRVSLNSGVEEAGELVHCGVDVVVLRSSRRDLVYVAIGAVTEILLPA